MTTEEVKALILASLPDAKIDVRDMTGTGDHFEVTVTSGTFVGKSIIEQHRTVFAALEKQMGIGEGIHAVQLKTRTPNVLKD